MDDDEMPHTSEKIAENVVLLAWARVSMALAMPAIGLICWLGWTYIGNQFDDINKTLDAAKTIAQTAMDQSGKNRERIGIVEANQANSLRNNDKFQKATIDRLDRIQDALIGLSNSVSALNATVKNVVDEEQRRGK